MLRRTALLLIAALVIVPFSSCQRTDGPAPGTGTQTAELVFGIENDLTNLDPIKSQEPYSLQVIGQMFEGLVTLNERNEITPLLAESYTHNDDYTVWQFKIRRGVYFHEDDSLGAQRTREMTAEDVRDSFQRIVSKDSYPSFVLADAVQGVPDFQAGRVSSASGLRVVSPDTFEIQLQQPEPYFLYRITSPWFCVFPREAVALGPDVFGKTRAVGTGPFRLVQRSDTEVVLERNPRYWRQVGGNVSRLVFRVIKNEQIRLAELRNGNLSMMRLPLALMPGLLNPVSANQSDFTLREPFSNDFTVQAFPTFNTHFIGFNCDRMNVHLRRAISLAINRQELVQAITHGSGTVTPGTVTVGLLGYQPPYTGDIFNLDRAREELRLANLNPRSARIELLVHEKDNTEQLGQLIQSQLRQIGLEVVLQKLDYNTVIGRMVEGNTQAFALAFEYVFSAPEPTLNNIFNSNKIPVPNFWRYRNPAVDAQLARLRTISDRAEANSISQSIERQVIDDAPAAFLYQLRNLVVSKRNLSNVAFNGHSIPLLWEVRVGR